MRKTTILLLCVFFCGCLADKAPPTPEMNWPTYTVSAAKRDADYQAEKDRKAKEDFLKQQIRWKDQERWFNFYRDSGYTNEEASYKADRMVNR